jgi:hypothetical protein
MGADGYGRIDVRCQILTDDGAALYVQYYGIIEMNQKAIDAVAKVTWTRALVHRQCEPSVRYSLLESCRPIPARHYLRPSGLRRDPALRQKNLGV